MGRRPPPRHAVALTVVKSVVLVAVVALGFGLVGGTGPEGPAGQPPASTVEARRPTGALLRAMDRHDCVEVDFDADVQPRSALVRRHGRLLQVSFEEGWEVFTERRPGRLLALCLDDLPPVG
ncbi:hypothetical protein [Nocardioides sp. 503]|uniref:hypothetical protein n=1 Tax=Nocardioides sp. 503 TaxID=2508326 RepID=UPI0010702F99|nr:hypothetical protein [Nocardioides sp. 503]